MIGNVRGKTPGTAERLVGRTVLFPESWALLASVGYRKPSSLSLSDVRSVGLSNGGSRFEKNEPRGQNRPVVIVVGFDQIIPLSQCQESQKKLCVASHDKRVVTAMAGLELRRPRLQAWTAKNDCCRCRGVVGCGSMGWAAFVQRRTGGRRTQPTNHPLQPSGDHPFFHGTSIRRRRLNGVVLRSNHVFH